MNKNCSSSNACQISVGNLKKTFGENFTKQLDIYKKNLYLNSTEEEKSFDKISDNDIYEKIATAIDYKDITCMNKWKNGSIIPNTEVIVKLAIFFDCSIDELLTGKSPYNDDSIKDEKQFFSKKSLGKLSIWKQERKRLKPLFGEYKEPANITMRELLNDIICLENIEQLNLVLNHIVAEFSSLTDGEIRTCNKALEEHKDKYKNKYKDDYTLRLEALVESLPNHIKQNIVKYIGEIELLTNMNKSAYVLRMFNERTKDIKKD